MGNQMLTRGGSYGSYSPQGAPIGLSPAMLEALIIEPSIRAMIAAAGRQAPDQNQTAGLMNWANSQAHSSRAIQPTIPGLTLPPAVQQILAQIAPLSSKANQLAGTVTGGQQIDPISGQFVPPNATPGTQSQTQQPTSGATGQPSPDFVKQIVLRAVAAALGGGGDITPGAGTSPGGPGPGGPFEGNIGGQSGGDTKSGGGSMTEGTGGGGNTQSGGGGAGSGIY